MAQEKMEEQINHIEQTVDTLARLVGQGFENIDETFKKVSSEIKAGFDSVDVRFEQVNGKIDGLHRRIDDELEHRKVLEDHVSKIEDHIGLPH